jgi:outer membrane protein TolC
MRLATLLIILTVALSGASLGQSDGEPVPSELEAAAETVGGDTSHNAEDGVLSLADCLAIARIAHEDTIIAREEVVAASAQLEGTEAAQYPRADIQGDVRLGNFGPRIVDPGGSGTIVQDTTNAEAYVNLTWQILNPRRSRLIERGKHVESQTRAASKARLRDLDLSVATAFIDLIRAQELVRIQRDILGIDEESLRIAMVRQQVGDGTEVETVQARAQVALVAQALLAAENAVDTARLNLLASMGLEEDPGVAFVAPELPLALEPPSLTTCLERAYATRQDIVQLQRALDISGVDVSLARLGARISYDATASAYTTASSGFSEVTWQVAFTATIPLFDGGAASSELDAAEAREIISKAQLSSTLRAVWQDVTESYRDWESAREQVFAASFAADAALRSSEQTQASFEAGVSSFFETLNARLQYVQARQQVADAEAAYLRAVWSLDRACPGALVGVNPLSDGAARLDDLLAEAERTPPPDDDTPPAPGGAE